MVLTSLAIVGCVTFASLSLATTVLNLIIIIAVLKDPLKKLRTLFNYYCFTYVYAISLRGLFAFQFLRTIITVRDSLKRRIYDTWST